MAKNKIHVRKGDTVVIISGDEAGQKGKVLEVLPKENRVVVEGRNIVKRHTRPTQKLPQGGIIEKEAPIASSNVMIYCPKCDGPRRIGKQILENGKKIRVCRKCGETLDK
ncbi:50S ribosomal protein L24 [Thermincola ferriacetica]|uniref:Large ribosomal subunit protein uL24 n=2 Tax=Thermincola TaxID=278993 RepID=D5XA94_THEPJ|nr:MULTISPECIES: 50S ribosomal protein L24 [Thermincola]ADG81193.1 ribosomal protein L24 [Thermincola potens JR]KNZ69469.1 50S ribosomal protein L24 [Thermincola ferriacetica]